MSQKFKYFIIFTILGIVGLFLRVWHINFGLPHSFYADEPELVELAVKYTFELKNIVLENNWYKMIPISYVYGTFPTYFLTGFTILFSKVSNLVDFAFDKADIYVYLRVINALFSMLILPTVAFLYHKLFKDKLGAVVTFFLLAFNWKLIVHAHYVNPDVFVATLLALSYLTVFLYGESKRKSLYVLLTGLLVGLAVGTKITVLIGLPLYWFIFLRSRDFRSLVGFSFVALGAFMVSNPFSIMFANDFVFRIYSMMFKEAGLVFDSVDTSVFKYVVGLSWISTLPVLGVSAFGIFSILGGFKKLKSSTSKDFHLFLLSTVAVYLGFYSLQSRRVDRWLLPVLPIVLMYSAHGVVGFWRYLKDSKVTGGGAVRLFGMLVLAGIFGYYLYFPVLLMIQFQRNTPKSASYIWTKENTDIQNSSERTLAYTEEGIDPLNKLPYADVYQFNVYEGDGAFLFFPADPYLYKYIILASRPMENFKRNAVVEKYPDYARRWATFEQTVKNSGDFALLETFERARPESTPNLIPLSNVYIYEKR